MWRVLAILLVCLELLSCNLSSKACTLIGCIDAVTLDFSKTPLPEGEYEFEITTPEASGSCRLRPGDGGGSWFSECDEKISADVSYERVTVHGTPKSVSVRVLSDGALLGEVSGEPTYEDYYPNGKECDETPCRGSSISVTLKAPVE